ncbi:MAG: S-formylglutathione hydrolase [Alphaproteobacteria bacterium TMED89]|nr:S-formylglutathione hydrolase [Rhodospirillaceae bacterium]RPH17613.1 MAG: S-formylglutathione hydrolase [Alphaproteobacteria bacterium TMED89]
MNIVSECRCFGGRQLTLEHQSASTGTTMRVAVFLPPKADTLGEGETLAGLVFLSGLTCTEENVTIKSGVQRYAAEAGLAFIAPDTSPRGEGVADDERYNMGQGAGFYVDATQAPWAPHFKMESYITKDLIDAVTGALPIDRGRLGVSGHSMGGHGALTLALRHPGLFKSLSAFAPIAAPMDVEWGQVCLGGYLGEDQSLWEAHDASRLYSKQTFPGPVLIDQGDDDPWLDSGLRPELLEAAFQASGQEGEIRRHAGYDHSYFFVGSFFEDHIRHHARQLGA